MANPKRRQHAVDAILGQKAGLATLGSSGCASFFILQQRILLRRGAASHARASPSGVVPGGSRSGRDRRWSIVGELGPDRVSAVVCRVCSAKIQGRIVILFYFGVPHVTLPPLTF